MILAIQSVSKRQTIEITYCKNLNAFARNVERKDGQIRFVRNTNIYKFCKLSGTIFSAFYNVSRSNFAILLIKSL